MLVESHDEFGLVGDFDSATGKLVLISRDSAGALLEQPLRGHFAELGEQVAILYRHDNGRIKFRLGDFQIEPGESESVQWNPMGSMAEIKLVSAGQILASAKYQRGPDSYPGIEDDPTPFAEAEDWDFGLFVRNILSDSVRSATIYHY